MNKLMLLLRRAFVVGTVVLVGSTLGWLSLMWYLGLLAQAGSVQAAGEPFWEAVRLGIYIMTISIGVGWFFKRASWIERLCLGGPHSHRLNLVCGIFFLFGSPTDNARVTLAARVPLVVVRRLFLTIPRHRAGGIGAIGRMV